MGRIPDIQDIVMYALAFVLVITVHEYAHARAAFSAGDDTAKRQGRLSLNPIVHLDPLGTLMFVVTVINGFGLAWGKPVPVNPYLFKNPRWDPLKVSLWGPLSNIITAFVLGMVLRSRLIPAGDPLISLVDICIWFNLAVAFFNLIPVPPLDGSKILSSLLPVERARAYDYTMGRYGILILLGLLLTGIAGTLIIVPASLLYHLFVVW